MTAILRVSGSVGKRGFEVRTRGPRTNGGAGVHCSSRFPTILETFEVRNDNGSHFGRRLIRKKLLLTTVEKKAQKKQGHWQQKRSLPAPRMFADNGVEPQVFR